MRRYQRLDFGEGPGNIVHLLHGNAEAPPDLRQREYPAERVPIRRPLGRVDDERVLSADESQRCDHVADAGAEHIAQLQDLQPVGRRHDVAHRYLVVADASRLGELHRSLAQDVGGGEDAEHVAAPVDDEQRTHAPRDHHPVRLGYRCVAVDRHRAHAAQVGHHVGRG